MAVKSNQISNRVRPVWVVWFFVFLIAFAFVFWYGGRWIENDTRAMISTAENIIAQGSINPDQGFTYNNGYGYQSAVSMLSLLTGVSLQVLQTRWMPFWVLAIYPLAFVVFRSFSANPRVESWAAFLLFLHSDFLFTSLRGSHEKFTYTLILLSLFCLLKSYTARNKLGLFAIWVGVFYIAVFGLAAANTYFASSFVIALTVGLLASNLLVLWKPLEAAKPKLQVYQRLGYVTLTGLILIFLTMTYFYPSSSEMLYNLSSYWDRVSVMVLETQDTLNPYTAINYGWVSRWIYLAVSVFTWIALIGSFVCWLHHTKRLILDRQITQAPPANILLWLLYGGFGFQLGMTIVMDVSNVTGNFQVRLVPIIAVLGMVYLGEVFASLVSWISKRHAIYKAILAVVITCLIVGGFLKAANDPAVSNVWMFYSPGEAAAVRWTAQNMEYSSVWLGLDLRLRDLASLESNTTLEYDVDEVKPTTNNYLDSSLIRLYTTRREFSLPYIYGAFKVYDNGDSQLYHNQPQTAFQP